jgi:DNA primase catalytic core
MARIPESELEQLKNETSLVRLIETSGVALQKRGKDYAGLCPFHADDTASLVVTPEKNLWHCFGCGLGGGVIDWAMKKNGVSFRHAVELLREGIAPITDGPVKEHRIRVLPPPITPDADEQKLLNDVIDYYHRCLKQSPEALAYLAARGIGGGEAIDRFKLGFANRTLGLRLPEKTRKEGKLLRERLEKLGLYRDTGHEHFNGSLIVPVLDERGDVQEVYGRKITDNLRKGTAYHLYLPGPHRGVFNMRGLTASREIILCEALIDALSFWCAGYRNVTASYGAEGFTDEMLAAFKQHGTQRVLIAYDRDEAGDRAAEKLTQTLTAQGIECWRITFPKGMDANEYALKVQPASKSLGLLIRKAEWLGKGQAPTRSIEPVIEQEAAKEESEPDTPTSSSSLAAEPVAAEPAPMLPASPVPPAPHDMAAEVSASEIVLAMGSRRWRIRGLPKNLAVGVLKVNVMVSEDAAFHVDTLDLYNARARVLFLQAAANELRTHEDALKIELGRVLLKLEQVQDETIQKALEITQPAHPELTDAEREAALALLKAPDLMDRILADFERCGVVGEAVNKITAYLAATSRKLDAPLGVVVQSSSAAGKSSLMDAVLAFIPDEDKVRYSAMTGQSLYYLGATSLKHKVLAIAEEEGAQRASYALKLLQSEGELTIASTGTDADGNLITQEYRVEGPTALITTTTAIDVDEELMNRCLVLAVDEGREQTRAIHARQRTKRTLEGLRVRQEKQDVLALHRNAQRLLQPLAVVNPYADRLTFLDDRTRTRRDHEKYLTLIDTIALLHQHQRQIKTLSEGERTVSYIEVTPEDIARATTLAHEVLGRSLDELPPQTRRVLQLIQKMVGEQCAASQCRQADYRFSRKDARDYTGFGDTQLRLHLERLAALEYVLTHRGCRGQSFVYELLFDGSADPAQPHLNGLIDAAALTKNVPTTESSRGETPRFAGSLRGENGGDAGGLRPVQSSETPIIATVIEESAISKPETRAMNGSGETVSYTQPLSFLAASGKAP